MMRKVINIGAGVLVMLLLTAAATVSSRAYDRPTNGQLRQEIAICPEKSGGIYYAYPYTTDSLPEPPAGYEPFYISHYGRHGSRHLIKTWQYDSVATLLKSNADIDNLTQRGQLLMSQIDTLSRLCEGCSGALTPLGERQHKQIADRMLSRFPQVLTEGAVVSAKSSTEPRCIVSMAAFCETLKERLPALRIEMEVTPGNMQYIAYSTPQAKALADENQAWRQEFRHWCDSALNADRFCVTLFKNPKEVRDPQRLMVWLHNIAVGEQEFDDAPNLFDLFTNDELFALWQHLNYNMYVRHANSPAGNAEGMKSAYTLLQHIVDTAEERITGNGTKSASLIFGHDTNLIRLLALMQIDGCAESERNPEKYCEVWQDYRISPMAANLQLIFFKKIADEGKPLDSDNDILVTLRLNEQPVKVAGCWETETPYYYKWCDIKEFWKRKIDAAQRKD